MGRLPLEIDLERAEAILPRYTTAAPRYTSYPTAPVWGEAVGPDRFRQGLAGLRIAEAPLSLYVHVPFCRSLCHFCACNRVITHKEELPQRYLDAIEREIDTVRATIPGEARARQQHWGGGTPTHLHPDQIRRLHGAVVQAFPMVEGAEVSIEVDPRVTTEAQVEALRECGFNRISLGVQDFDERVQEAIHRIQPVSQTERLVDWSRRAGFESVNFDLIYGLPFQTEESFARTLDTVIALAPDRLALYSYAHVTWVAKQQRGFENKDLPDPPTKLRLFVLALRRFLDAGYVYIGMDHFARPEDELVTALRDRTLRRNFMGYTTQAGTVLLGFGPSAISDLRESYAQSHRKLPDWEERVLAGGLATLRGHVLSPDDQARRWVIENLMCHGRADAEAYRDAFGEDFGARYAEELERLEQLEEDGLVVREGDGSVQVTPLGRLLVRNTAMVFDVYLRDPTREARFSQAV